jgi:peptidoglycan/xylan/chitin deacetylase (PgdA/CDA1 family)
VQGTLKVYPFHIPQAVQLLYPDRIWRISSREDRLYLSFDDGPTPGVTDRILQVLDRFDAKATFFCTGRNAERHPRLMGRILEKGHGLGNHGYDHLYGKRYPDGHYIEDVLNASKAVPSPFFRPPYGRLKREQARQLSKEFRIVMWEVLAGDFDPRLDAETCKKKVIRHARKGSILLFHDSEKASERVEQALPGVLEHFAERGFSFHGIPGSWDHLGTSSS